MRADHSKLACEDALSMVSGSNFEPFDLFFK
jgi:hypothetical protein